MLKIRLARIGKKHQPFYRIAVFESHKDPLGNYVEKLGHYNPKTKEIKLNNERIKYWLEHGAQPSSTIHNLFVEHKVIDGKKVRVSKISKKRAKKMEQKKKGEKPQADKKEEKTEKESVKTEDKPVAKDKPKEKKDEPKQEPKAEDKPKEKKEEKSKEEPKTEEKK